MKILMADDNAVERRVLRLALERYHYDTTVCQDGAEAWERLQTADAPTIAILDWMMPGLNGTDICRLLRASPASSSVYVILLTSLDGTNNLVEGLEAGADDYVKKPFNIEELRARLNVATRILGLQENLRKRVDELEEAMTNVKRLQRLLPICSYCKSIRDDKNYWQQVDQYIVQHSDVRFSHGFCPDCYEKHVKVQLANLIAETQ
jgi:DNA-binding response OmpR family regulator